MIGRMFVGVLLLGGLCGVWVEFSGERPHYSRDIVDVLRAFSHGVALSIILMALAYAFGYVLGVV